jgi:hypothetical protein
VYKCQICTSYIMCHNCEYWCGMHWAHKESLTKLTLKEYFNT